ncbi:MAG: hypothetical protein A2X94_00485 [Bdellovibrionales bacterium GWB1_55_8]|nr:MAG: hypothetical protein A2X94_00485 [Bdellovibrionales bacterium GWB1_55_8]
MIRIEMTDQEAAILRDALSQFDHTSKFEIARTDDHDYRVGLEGREAIIARLIRRLDEAIASAKSAAA